MLYETVAEDQSDTHNIPILTIYSDVPPSDIVTFLRQRARTCIGKRVRWLEGFGALVSGPQDSDTSEGVANESKRIAAFRSFQPFSFLL